MIGRKRLLALFAGLVAFPAWAAAETRILVTFSDPGMNDAAVAGPAGPTYRRTSSSYLVSIGVKRAANRLARDFELELVDEWPILPLKVHCLVYSIADDVAVEALLQRINERPEVESAQLLNEFEVSASSTFDSRDPHVRLQHHVVALQLAEAHSLSRGEGVSITIIDTGADINHPELKSQIRDHADFVDPGHGEFSADAHGTAIAAGRVVQPGGLGGRTGQREFRQRRGNRRGTDRNRHEQGTGDRGLSRSERQLHARGRTGQRERHRCAHHRSEPWNDPASGRAGAGKGLRPAGGTPRTAIPRPGTCQAALSRFEKRVGLNTLRPVTHRTRKRSGP